MSDLLGEAVLREDRKIYRYLYIVNRGMHDHPPRLLFLLFLQEKYRSYHFSAQARDLPSRATGELRGSTTAIKDRIVVPSSATVPR